MYKNTDTLDNYLCAVISELKDCGHDDMEIEQMIVETVRVVLDSTLDNKAG